MKTKEAEIIKLAAAHIIKQEIEKTGGTLAGIGTLLGLAGLGFGYSQLMPESFEKTTDWFKDLFPIDWSSIGDWWGDFKDSIPFLKSDEDEEEAEENEGIEPVEGGTSPQTRSSSSNSTGFFRPKFPNNETFARSLKRIIEQNSEFNTGFNVPIIPREDITIPLPGRENP